MRWTAALVVVALALAVAAGAAYRSSVAGAVADSETLRDIPNLPGRFVRQHKPDLEFSLPNLPQWGRDPVLAHSSGIYAESVQFGCCAGPGDAWEPRKANIWYGQAMCGAIESLPAGFFQRPPYLHLSGQSYTYLAMIMAPEQFGNAAWVSANKDTMHVTELAAVAELGVELSPQEAFAATLTVEHVDALARGTDMLQTEAHVVIGLSVGPEPNLANFAVYERQQWAGFLAATPWITTPRGTQDLCLAVVGEVCFGANPRGVAQRLNQATALGGSALTVLLLALVLAGVQRLRSQQREQQARLFVLQTLSHEVRTPCTALALSLEPIRERFDDLPSEVQPAFLRICDDVQRLQRVIEASRQYLRGQVGERDIQFRRVVLPSAQELVAGILDGYEQSVHFNGEQRPVPVQLDPYWFAVCLRNLVDNALAHGKPPVRVTLREQAAALSIEVQDEGGGSDLNFKQMTAPFCRGPESDGLGFGLAVVKRLAEAMGGRLRFAVQPTRFTLLLFDAIDRSQEARR